MSKVFNINVIKKHINDITYTFNNLFKINYGGALLTIAVIAVSITIPSILYLLVKNINIYTSELQLGRNITVYINEHTDPIAVSQIKDDLFKDPRIENVNLILNTEALEDFIEALGITEEFITDNGVNPLPHVIVIQPKIDFIDEENLNELIDILKKYPQVEMVKIDKEWFKQIDSIINTCKYLTFTLGIVLTLSVILTVINTISSRVLLYKQDIEVMKLVGATDWYICQPYVYIGMWFGLCGVFLSIWLTSILMLSIGFFVNKIAISYNSEIILQNLSFSEIAVLLILCVTLTMIVAYKCAKTSINKIEPV